MKIVLSLLLLLTQIQVFAQSIEDEKLKLMSCVHPGDLSPATHSAFHWFNALAEKTAIGRREIHGPFELGGVCVTNIAIMAGPGLAAVKGEICNKSLTEFTETLAKVGVVLKETAKAGEREPILQSNTDKYTYSVFKGSLNFITGKFDPAYEGYTFVCGTKGGDAR